MFEKEMINENSTYEEIQAFCLRCVLAQGYELGTRKCKNEYERTLERVMIRLNNRRRKNRNSLKDVSECQSGR